jgi:hypothetical protein
MRRNGGLGWHVIAIAALAATSAHAQKSDAPVPPKILGELEIRRAVIGTTLDGVFPDGVKWWETYNADGTLDYMHDGLRMGGRWIIKGQVFCTVYKDGADGACWRMKASSENCFEFYLTPPPAAGRGSPPPVRDSDPGAHAWRRDKPSTCKLGTAV